MWRLFADAAGPTTAKAYTGSAGSPWRSSVLRRCVCASRVHAPGSRIRPCGRIYFSFLIFACSCFKLFSFSSLVLCASLSTSSSLAFLMAASAMSMAPW